MSVGWLSLDTAPEKNLRDHEHRSTPAERLKGHLDVLLRLRVQSGGGLVKQDDAWVLQYGPCDGDPLLLAAAEPEPALADHGEVRVREAEDAVVDAGGAAGVVHHLVRRVRVRVLEVVHQSLVEQDRVLRNDADVAPERLDADVADVLSVDQDPAPGGAVEAEQEPEHRRLAAAGFADESRGGAGRGHVREPVERRLARVVGELDLVELDASVAGGQRHDPGVVHHRRLLLEELEHALRVDHRALDAAVERAEEVQRALQLGHVRQERDELADLTLSAGHLIRRDETRRQKAEQEDDVLDDVHQAQRQHHLVL